jgi:serine protease Do
MIMSEDNKNQPSYTFWAEQVNPSQTVNNSNTETNTSDMYQTTDTNTSYYSQPVMAQPDLIPPSPEVSFEPPVKKRGKAKRFFGFLGKAAVFGIIASLSYYGTTRLINHYDGDDKASRFTLSQNSNGKYDLNLDSPSGAGIPSTSVSTNVNIQSTDISQVVEDTMPATVSITSTFNASSYDVFGYEYGGENTGGGSGIIIGQKDNELFIATNNHVVEGATKIKVTFIDGSEADAVIRGRNSSADLAVITVDTKTMTKEALSAIKVAKLGNSETVKVGQMAIAIGNALGYGQSVTVGYISAKDREIAVDQNTKLTVLQTDAAINPGNSGGALININGEVIGINSAKFSDTDVEGMGYSIPISIAYPIVDELMNREVLTEDEKGYLGVYPQDVDSSVASLYDWPIGVYVSKLVEGGAAEKAGIYVGDIITAVNNITLSSSDMLRETVNSYRFGTSVKVTLMRFVDGEYKELTVDVVLQKASE